MENNANNDNNQKKEPLSGAKDSVKSVLGQGVESVKKGLKKAVETIAATLAQPDPGLLAEEFKNIIVEELTLRLSTYYSGVMPEITDLTIEDNSAANEFNISAKITKLHSSSLGIQEANLQALVEIPDASYYHIPVPGAYGLDTFPPAPLPIYDYKPRIKKIALEITNSNYRSEIAFNVIQDMVKRKYPHAELIDKSTPMEINNETISCERFISDRAAARGGQNNLLRLIKFPVKKVPLEKIVDECLYITDYEFQLQPPEDVYTIDFPNPREIKKTLMKEKNILLNKANDTEKGFARGLRKLFFRIGDNFNKIEPRTASEEEISFEMEFNCISGFGPFSKSLKFSTVLYYAIDPHTNNRGDKTMSFRYLKRDDILNGG